LQRRLTGASECAMKQPVSFSDKVQNAAIRVILGGALMMPYQTRVQVVGKVMSRIVSPLAGWRRRILNNLAYVCPEMSAAERGRIAVSVADNVGRTLIEIYSGEEFVARARKSEVVGPGLPALAAAQAEGRPIVMVTAHLGNYDAVRSKLSREGYPMAALYKPMKNKLFHAHYLKAISTIAEPVYPTNGRGIAALIKHLKAGGTLGIVADVGSRKAPLLRFFDKPAHTPVSSAEWAVKYDALMVPVFGLRQPDGLTFRLHVAEPIPAGDPAEMMQVYNDTVEEIVRAHPEQWFWIHRRWKLSTEAKLSEAVTPPE
ncbi:MAG: lysophospholipid acyltransferase family protein, partial [Pseudomonadota bacterium]